VQGLVSFLAAVAAAGAIAALALHVELAWWLMPLVLPVSVWTWHLACVSPRELCWDGQCWRLSPAGSREAGPAMRLQVVMDFGSWLLLQADGHLYLPLAANSLGSQWSQLRATLYSARTEVPHAQPPHEL
jgi:hypothetical protein